MDMACAKKAKAGGRVRPWSAVTFLHQLLTLVARRIAIHIHRAAFNNLGRLGATEGVFRLNLPLSTVFRECLLRHRSSALHDADSNCLDVNV